MPVEPQTDPYAELLQRARQKAPSPQVKQPISEPSTQTMAGPPPKNFDTPLSQVEEKQFQQWKQRHAPHDSGEDYDLRGAFKAGIKPHPKTGHWPDTYKKPNHPTFSNQSKYAAFAPEKAGHWQGDVYVPPASKAGKLDPLPDYEAVLNRARESSAKTEASKARGEAQIGVHESGSVAEAVFTSNLIGNIPLAGSGFRVRDMYRRLTTSSPEEERVAKRSEQFAKDNEGKPLTARAVGEAANIEISKFVTSMGSPGNIALMMAMEVAAPVKALKLLTEAGFAAQAAEGVVQGIQSGVQHFKAGNPSAGVQGIMGALISGGFAYQMGKAGFGTAGEIHTQIKTELHLDALANESFQKPWDSLDHRQQAAILYDLAKQKNAPVTAEMAAALAKQPTGTPGQDRAAEVLAPFVDSTRQARATVATRAGQLVDIQRPGIVPPPPPPAEATPEPVAKQPFREGPDHYALNVRPMSPAEREAKRYSLEEARKQLDGERQVAARELEVKDAAERDRQRIARERKESAEGEAAYQAARSGRSLVVQDRRPLKFDNDAAENNYREHERLSQVLDSVAVEHMYEDSEDMLRSLRMERYRGIDLKSKYGDWAESALKTDARAREYLKLSDPRALEPKPADVAREAATDMRLAEREMNMRDAADAMDREAKSNVTEPEVFEKAKAEADEARRLAEDIRTQRDEAAARRHAQIADRQIYPVGAPIDLVMGAPTEVLLPSGRRLKAHYALALGDQIVTSHNPLTFAWNDDYGPRQAQPRDYETNKEAQAGVITGGNAPEPERIHTDDPSPHNGPPIMRRDGLVLGGNGRSMRLQRAYRLGNGDTVFRHLRSKLEQFGLSDMPELEKKPSLVRVLDDDVETAEDLFVLGRDLNRTETMGFDEAEAAVVAGRAITDEMLSWGTAQMDALGEDASVRDFMRARGSEIIQRMMDSGMIEPTKRAGYITREGEMTETAKLLFENAWLGKWIDDPDLLKTIPDDVKRKLTRGVVGGLKAKAAGGQWDISPEVKDSLKLWKTIDSTRDALNDIGKKGDSLVDRYLHPEDFENGTARLPGVNFEQPHPTAEAIAKLLEKKAVDVRDGFSDYGNEAEGKQAQLLGPRPDPVDAFNSAIGNKVDIKVEPEQWNVPMAPTNKDAVLAPETPVQARPESKVEEVPEKVPSPLESTPSASSEVVQKLRSVLAQHPGFQGIADEVLQAADILSRNGMGKSLDEMLPEILADVRTEGEPGSGGMEQEGDVAGWARRAGKKLTITPYGEQLDLFGGAEPQFLLRNRVGDERLVLKSELIKMRADVPRLAELVGADGAINQAGLFGAEEENLFGPGPDEEDKGPQGTLFQAPPEYDWSKTSVGKAGEKDTADFDAARAELYPEKTTTDLSLSEMSAVLKRANEIKLDRLPLTQAKKGAIEFLNDGKAIMYLYKTADASTFMHEFFHVMRRHLKADDIKVLEDWLKIKDGKWGRSAEETAARSFEHYHRQREVKTMPEKVRAVFKKIQDAMRQIYQAIKGSPLVKPSKEVSALFDRWYGMEEPPEAPGEAKIEAAPEPAQEAPQGVSEMEAAIREGQPNAITSGWVPGAIGDGKAAMEHTRKELETAGWKWNGKNKQFEKNGWYVWLRSQGDLSSPILQWDRLEKSSKGISEPPTSKATLDIPQELGPKKEKIAAATELEHPPLTASEREGAELVAEGGRRLLDTGKVRVKVFPEYAEAASWATTNAKKIRSMQLYKLKDGRYVADFVPNNEKVLFQTDETSDINREITGLQKRLGSMMPEGQRAMIAQRLFDLEERRRSLPISTPSLEPPPGQVVRLWTPEGEEAVIPKQLEVSRVPEAKPVRTATDVPAAIPEPPRFGGVPERPEPSRISRPEPVPRQPVRSGRGTEEPRVVGGQPTGTLRAVEPIRIDAPVRPAKPPAYSDKDWTEKVKLYELPENAPTPTVGISNELARMLMGGQRYIVESALSGLDRHDSFILATPTGSGKTFSASAILHHLLQEKPDAQVLILTTSRGLIDGRGGFKDVMSNFGIEVQDLDKNGPTGTPGVYAETWSGSGNRQDIESHPWDLVIADEVQEARKWWSSQRGQRMKTMGNNAKKVLYMSATPFHTALEIGHMDKLGLWKNEGYEAWAKQFGVRRDDEGNFTGGNAPLKLIKLRNQLIERGQYINIPKSMEGYSAHFGVVPMDSKTAQGLSNIKEAMQIAENYFYAVNKRGKVQPTRAQAVTLAKRWLEFQRLPQAIELGKKLQDQGWKVIFFSENKKEFDEVFEFLKEADEGTGGRISALLPRFRSVTDVLQEHFGDDIAIFAGKHSAARQEELSAFNEDDKPNIYMTYGAGGVGVNAHDTIGSQPRAVVYLGPPWSGIAFDQALGRPWRYGTKSNVRAYFLFSNAQAEMDVVTNKIAPRMESLRALVSGVHLTDPLVKALRDVPENREATLDYELGNEHKAEIDNFTKTGDVRTVTSYSELPIVHADQAKNKGMKLPGGEGATAPNVVRLFQSGVDEDVVPSDMESPALQTARNINVDITQGFIESGAAPGSSGLRALTPIQRRAVADVIMAQAEGAARSNPGAATQEVYTAWQNAMTQMDAILSASNGGDGMQPPPTGMEILPPPPGAAKPREVGPVEALNWYMFTNGRDVIRNATEAAGVPEIGEKMARDIASYHVYGGNKSGPWVNDFFKGMKDHKITKEEFKVAALTQANREEHRPWIDRELMRLRAETPMNDRIGRMVDVIERVRKQIFREMQHADVYLTVWDADSGRPRKVMYQDMNLGEGYWPRKYDYDEVHTVVDPETNEEIKFTLKQMTDSEGPGASKKDAIIRGMMDRHGLSRAAVEDWLGHRKRPVPLVGHVERAREADLPFFRTDPDVFVAYMEGAGELLARKKYFGQDGDKVAGAMAQIPHQKMRSITKGVIDGLLQRNPMAEENRWMMRLGADWAVLSKMTFGAVKVLGHPVHAGLVTNIRSLVGGLWEGTANYSEAAHRANLSGSIMEQTKVEQLSEFGVRKKSLASSMLKYNMWQGAYKWGRVVSDATARVFMDKSALPKLIRNPENVLYRRRLKEELLLSDAQIDAAIERGRWTDEDHHWGAKALSDKVMFTFDPTELPPAWRGHSDDPAAQAGLSAIRMATLLRGYQFKTHALLKDAIYDRIKNHGDFRALLPFLLLYPAAGELIRGLTALAHGNKKYFKELMDSKSWTPGQMLERYVDDIAHMIGDSFLSAAISQFHKGHAQFGEKIIDEWVVGAIPSDLMRTASTAMQVAFGKNNRAKGKAVHNWARETFPVMQTIDSLTPAPSRSANLSPLPPPPAP